MNTIALIALSFLPYFEARNQIANFVVKPPPDGVTVKSEKPDLVVRSKCPACEGRGELVLEEPDFGQAKGRLGGGKKTRRKCPICRGAGKTESFMNPAELTVQVARDREQFRSDHQGRGEIAVGEAFVPNATYAELDRKTLKLVEDAYGKPCNKCNWTGIEACRKCSGQGLIPCTESDCKGGFLVTKTTTERTRTSSGGNSFGGGNRGGMRSSGSRRTSFKETKVTVQECPTCGGSKYIVCPECGGRKAHPCKRCSGLGTKQKAGSL